VMQSTLFMVIFIGNELNIHSKTIYTIHALKHIVCAGITSKYG
jgi:hypothetical protein